jgi:hypothetical protein
MDIQELIKELQELKDSNPEKYLEIVTKLNELLAQLNVNIKKI